MPIRPKLLPHYPGGSIKSPEWLAIRHATLVLAGFRCEFCRVKDRTSIIRGHDETYMTLDGTVFSAATGKFLRTVGILSYRGRFVDIVLTTAHVMDYALSTTVREVWYFVTNDTVRRAIERAAKNDDDFRIFTIDLGDKRLPDSFPASSSDGFKGHDSWARSNCASPGLVSSSSQ
ncbi:MAG: hypothetical protein ACR2RA_26485 [Geminicoccaceae bacterium]